MKRSEEFKCQMNNIKLSILFISSTFIFCLSACHNKKSEPNPELASIDLLRGDILLCSGAQFGDVSFSFSCQYSTRENFDLGLSLLHSFEYAEAERAFVKVMDEDPDCPMAYWGIAMSIFHPLWAPPNKQELIKGSKILKIADGLPKNDREQDYLDAIGAFYKDWENLDHQTRTKNFEIKMGEVYKKRTDDKEAAVFYALALNASADKSDKTYKNQRKAGEILESLFPDQPNHPGIAHYIIHNYDNPVLAKKALPTARRYADIAPGSAHAQHMPSHIFTRLGLWDESIASNIKSTSSALCYAQNGDIEGHWDEEIHGMDYLVYAYLQQGDNEKAIEQLRYLQSIDKVFPVNFKIYALTAIPSRIAMENKNWDAAAKLEFLTIDIPWEKFPWVKSIIHFSRSIGASRSGQIDLAENEIDILENLYKKLLDSGDSYKANQVLIEINSAKAWLSFAKGYNENAIELMKEAVRLEDNTEKNPTTPGEILPARELLGDMYLAMDKPVKALDAYEMDFKIHPNRFNGIYGAAISAKKLGNNLKAKQYFEKLLILSENSNGTRPEIKESNEFLNKNKLST